jgi:hypothetical protein
VSAPTKNAPVSVSASNFLIDFFIIHVLSFLFL